MSKSAKQHSADMIKRLKDTEKVREANIKRAIAARDAKRGSKR